MGVCFMREKLSQEFLRSTFEYLPETGRLLRVRKGRGARVGAIVGHHTDDGFIRVNLFNRNWTNAHLVWVWHHGEFPPGILRRKNGINSDDRIENLEIIKKPLSVARTTCIHEADQYGRVTNGISGIYEIVCTENGRRYIGSAVNIDKRWREHVRQLNTGRHHSPHLQRAWDKYQQDAFVFRLIEECAKSDLISREQHYLDSISPEFNCAPKAGSQLGYRHSEAARRQMSLAAKGNTNRRGRKMSAESREKISAAKRGVGQSDVAVARRAAALRERMGRNAGNKFTEHQIRYIRAECEKGRTLMSLAGEMGVSDSVISEIKNRKSYRWVL